MSILHKKISKVAVLGSGIMGSRIACHFANIGLEVVLLDMPDDKKQNSIVNNALQNALKSKPSPIYKKEFAQQIKTGNFEENMSLINDCDWVIEVIIEKLSIKKELYEKVEKHRKAGSFISSNTSGIPIEMLIEGRSEDFKKYFCGTHFFNPPRYLKLFEIIPSSHTDKEVVLFFEQYARLFLGKNPLICKDTPAFTANRIGVFSIMAVFHTMRELNMSIEDVDSLTGQLIGRPKSATFRTADVVGIDTLVKVAQGVQMGCPQDEAKDMFTIPNFVAYLVENNMLGDKTGSGFYKKVKVEGKTEILSLDINTNKYTAQEKTKFKSVGVARQEDNLKKRIKILFAQDDLATQFLKKVHYQIFAYISHRIPEISDYIYNIDEGMKSGFGWEMGPYELWDLLGVKETCEAMKSEGIQYAAWIDDMIATGVSSFYTIVNTKKLYYDINSKKHENNSTQDSFIILDTIRKTNTVWSNQGCNLIDLGDGILNVEFNTKMNAIGSEIIEGVHKALDLAEKGDFRGVVLGNEAQNFSAGANLAMVYMLAIEQEFDELNMVVRAFQNAVMRLRYSSVPVVAAPHGLTLGGACEMTMHCDAAIASAESYIGLVEVGVGLIPGGGGTKELALRVSDSSNPNEPFIPHLSEKFTAIATAQTSTSAYEAFDIGLLDSKKDAVSIHTQRSILMAKQKAISLAENGYVKPNHRSDIYVMGRNGLAALYAGVEGFEIGGYASAYDKKIAKKIAWILCGGDLSSASYVTEQYLLDLEREAFLSLLGERKTLERIQSILTTGKPLRN